MFKEFDLLISTPKKIWINKKAIEVTFFTEKGYITILANHSKIIGSLSPGLIWIKYKNSPKQIAILNYGLYHFINNKLMIVSDFFEFCCHGVDTKTIKNIQEKINEQSLMTKLPEKNLNFLNSYMKLLLVKSKKIKK